MVDSNLIKIGVDGYRGNVAGDYSVKDSQETLRQALIEANNGSSTLNFKDIRDGKCSNLFSIMEVLINKISEEGFRGDEAFNTFVEDRNKALGDSDVFHVTRDCILSVADIAEGSQSVRRQRIESGSDVTIQTKMHAVKIYEEMNRVLAGRIDFNKLVDMVGQSFTKYDLDAAYAAWAGMFNALTSPYKETGSFDEDKLMTIVEHVEAETGDTAIILGTQKALRKITTATVSDQAKNDMYSLGHYGMFNGTQMVRMRQRHAIGSTNFILPDNTIYVVAGDSRPIKRVTEGDVTMLMGNPMDNADLTQEFLMMKRSGVGVVMDRAFGTYQIS